MTNDEFQRYVQETFYSCFTIMNQANQEYASEAEKFDNFEGIAELLRRFNPRLKEITAPDVGFVYLMKHLISIMKQTSIREPMDGRVVDAINYVILIGGMVQETQVNKLDELASNLVSY